MGNNGVVSTENLKKIFFLQFFSWQEQSACLPGAKTGVRTGMFACEPMRRHANRSQGGRPGYFGFKRQQKQLQNTVTGCYTLDLSLTISCIQVCFRQASMAVRHVIGAASIGFQLFPRQDAFMTALFFIEQGRL